MEENKDKKNYVTIPNRGDFELNYLLGSVDYALQLSWTRKLWEPTPALIDKTGGYSRPYVGQKYDPNYFDLAEDGWTHDHCEICLQTISDKEGYGDTDGYKADGGEWLCNNCYNLFIKSENVQETINSLQTLLR